MMGIHINAAESQNLSKSLSKNFSLFCEDKKYGHFSFLKSILRVLFEKDTKLIICQGCIKFPSGKFIKSAGEGNSKGVRPGRI